MYIKRPPLYKDHSCMPIGGHYRQCNREGARENNRERNNRGNNRGTNRDNRGTIGGN